MFLYGVFLLFVFLDVKIIRRLLVLFLLLLEELKIWLVVICKVRLVLIFFLGYVRVFIVDWSLERLWYFGFVRLKCRVVCDLNIMMVMWVFCGDIDKWFMRFERKFKVFLKFLVFILVDLLIKRLMLRDFL